MTTDTNLLSIPTAETNPSQMDEISLYPPSYEESLPPSESANFRQRFVSSPNITIPEDLQPPPYEYHSSNPDPTLSDSVLQADPKRMEKNGRFLSVDFFPSCTRCGWKLRNILPQFAPFGTLIQHANYWLQRYPNYRVLTAETIQCSCEFTGEILYDDSLQFNSAFGWRLHVSGLRLWLYEDCIAQNGVQQICYMNVTPRYIRQELSSLSFNIFGSSISLSANNPSNPVFEDLSTTLSKFNEYLKQTALPGVVFSTELLQSCLPRRQESSYFDPDCSLSSEISTDRNLFLKFIRVFYFPGAGTTSEIGVKIFPPEITIRGSKMEFESSTQVARKGFDWIEANRDKIITNMKVVVSLEHFYSRSPVGISSFFPVDNPVIDTDKVINVASSNNRDSVSYIYWEKVRSLCVTYIPLDQIQLLSAPLPPVLTNLSCREFTPCKVTKSCYESVRQTLFRMTEWIAAAKAEVVHIETMQIQHTPKYRNTYSENSSNVVIFGKGIYYLVIYRVYFCGPVEEPRPEDLSPIPVIEKNQKSMACSLM